MSETKEKNLWYFNTTTKKRERKKVLVTETEDKDGYYPPKYLYNDKDEKLLAFIPLNVNQILFGIIDE